MEYAVRGRPPIFTAQRADAIVEAISQGLPYTVACKRAGISKTTYTKWIKGDVGGLGRRVAEAEALRVAQGFKPRKARSATPGSKSFAPKGMSATPTGKAAKPGISIQVTWEVNLGGLEKLAEILRTLDRVGALALAIGAAFPKAEAKGLKPAQ